MNAFFPQCRYGCRFPGSIEELEKGLLSLRSHVFEHVIADTVGTWGLLALEGLEGRFKLVQAYGV